MPEHDDSQEISEETQRLVDSLGERLAAEQRRAAMPSDLQRGAMMQERSISEEKIRDLERQIAITRGQIADGGAELRRLEEMLEFLMRDLYTPRSELHLAAASMRAPDEPQSRDYLAPVLAAAAEQRSASFWLWGDNARERRTALKALGEGLNRNRGRWSVIEVDFLEGSRPTSAPRGGGKLPYLIKDTWERWTPKAGAREARMMQFNLREVVGPEVHAMRETLTYPPVVLILMDFPGRRRNANSFLAWMSEQLTMATKRSLLIVSSDRPPRDDKSAGKVIECVSAGARVGRKIAALRLERGWNRAELAKRAGLEASYLAEVEGGIAEEIDPLEIKRIALGLGVPSWELENA